MSTLDEDSTHPQATAQPRNSQNSIGMNQIAQKHSSRFVIRSSYYRKMKNLKSKKYIQFLNETEKTTVLILGGGLAGITAAHTLYEAGMTDFILLEAADRIGGRVC